MALHKNTLKCRNPYFIGINSAINATKRINKCVERVAILILLELTLQLKITSFVLLRPSSRNPYFIGINSAIKNCKTTSTS